MACCECVGDNGYLCALPYLSADELAEQGYEYDD